MATSGRSSLINIVLLYLSLMGLGAIGGYGSFYFLFSERCSQLIMETKEKHSSSRQQFQQKYENALEGQRQCLADSSAKRELRALQGRLEAQSNLADRHQVLLQKQEDTLTRLSEVQSAQEATGQTVATLHEELTHTKAELAEANRKLVETLKSSDEVETGLRSEVTTATGLVDKQAQDVIDMTEQLDECDSLLPSYRDEAVMMKNYLRTRHHEQCKME
jgi:chromosome segregation ATPase